MKCKELKHKLNLLQGDGMVTPAVSSRFRPDAQLRSQVLELESQLEGMRSNVITARAGRRDSDALMDELTAARMELQTATNTTSALKLRSDTMEKNFTSLTERYEACQETVRTAATSLSISREVCRSLEGDTKKANSKIEEMEVEIKEMQNKAAVEKVKHPKELERQAILMQSKTDDLKALRCSVAQTERWDQWRAGGHGEAGPKAIKHMDRSSWEWYDSDLENTAPNMLSPDSKKRRRMMLQRKCRSESAEFDKLYEAIGEGCDPTVLAKVLEATNSIDHLQDTKEFWLRRIEQGKDLVSTVNSEWDAQLSARIKADYLLSDRDLCAMRVDWSSVLVNNKPRPKIALANPFLLYDVTQRVHFPEPITKKSRVGGWGEVIQEATAHFGLVANADHVDATERDFNIVLQQLIDRDTNLLPTHEELGGVLNVVLGFDGADDFCHSCVRLIDYKEGVAKESELKGVGLTVAIGDDHNFNLNLQFRRIGPAINVTINTGGDFTLRGQPITVDFSTCLDYSATRSMYGMRSNSSPHSSKLHGQLIIDTKSDASWKEIDAEIEKKMPWCQKPSVATCRNHIFSVFPAKCGCCPYKVGSEEEQDSNITTALAMRGVKTKAGKAAWAARVKDHCEAHEDVMEFETAVLDVHPRDNIVDMLHAMHINIPNRIASFSFHDQVNFALDPELKHALTAYYTFIKCPFDLNGDKTWWHGAAWCYDFVMGVSKDSPGLDMNILICCLIVFGTSPKPNADAKPVAKAPTKTVINDLPGRSAPKAKKAKPLTPLMQLLKPLFGSNAEKVQAIFESWTAYAEVFMAVQDKWESSSTEYKEERASRLYRAGIACLLTTPHAPRPSPHVHICGVLV